MLSSSFVAVAVTLRFASGLSYLVATWKGTIRPNPVTWLLWALTPLVAFAAQRQDGVGAQAWMTAATGVGPLLIFLVALGRRTSWRVGFFDVLCGVCAVAGVVLWQVTTDPALAVMFSIVADALAGIPTVRKAYRSPDSEKTFPYWLNIAAFSITLFTVSTWNFVNCAFFCYGVLINLVVSTVVSVRSARPGRPEHGIAGQARHAHRPAASRRLFERPFLAATRRARISSDGTRIEDLEARVAELERLLAMEWASRSRPPQPSGHSVTVVERDPWEGWEGSA
jgi:hypothetical protein